MRNLLVGLAAAGMIAVVIGVPSIAGISTWKYLLGAFGFFLFVKAGRSGRHARGPGG